MRNWKLKVISWHPSRWVNRCIALIKRLKGDLHMIENCFPTTRLLSGECNQFKDPLDDYVCPSRLMTRMFMVTSLRFVSVYIIYTLKKLDTMRLKRCICQNGRRPWMMKRSGIILRRWCLKISIRKTGFQGFMFILEPEYQN